MNKFIKTGLVVALFFTGAGVASAAVNNVLFDNGAGGQQINSGEGVTMHAFVNTTIGQALESVFIKFPNATGIAQHGRCYTLNPPQEGVSPVNGWDIAVPVDNTPTSSGSWGPNVTFYGINGDPLDTQCAGSAVFASQFFPNRLVTVNANTGATVTTNSSGIGGSTNSGNNNDSQMPAWFTAWLATQPKPATTTTTVTLPATPTACATLALKMTGTVPGVYNNNNTILQGFLIGEGMSIPWLTDPKLSAGVPFGFFGNQTQAALSLYKTMHSCI